ncbi:MAG: hypothetical protein ACOYOQ_15190 [Microthrixaceae bacterium]
MDDNDGNATRDTISVSATGPDDIVVTLTFHAYDTRITLSTTAAGVGMERAGINPDPLEVTGELLDGLVATAKVNTMMLSQALADLATRG